MNRFQQHRHLCCLKLYASIQAQVTIRINTYEPGNILYVHCTYLRFAQYSYISWRNNIEIVGQELYVTVNFSNYLKLYKKDKCGVKLFAMK